MLYYMCAHSVYHLTRWFPRNNRLKLRVVVLLFSLALLAPQLYVLLQPHTMRYCGQPLLPMLIVSVIFTMIMLGFVFLFSLMDPVPWQIKATFHGFGLICFIIGLVQFILILQAEECKVFTEELYYWSLSLGIVALICICFFAILTPFWILNRVRSNWVFDHASRTGLCYEPVTCCSCLWHV